MEELSHFNSAGHIRMVDITAKDKSSRAARAKAELRFPEGLLEQILETGLDKGDLFSTARLSGIQAAKKTPDLIPLAHPVSLSHVSVELNPEPDLDQLQIVVTAKASDATGVEMEAMTAASIAALSVYDMCKSLGKEIVVESVCLLEKRGGSSGHWQSEEEAGFEEEND